MSTTAWLLMMIHYSVAGMVVGQLPSPLQLTPERVEKLMCSSAKTFDSFPRQTQLLKEGGSVCMSAYLSGCSLSRLFLLFRFHSLQS